MDEQGIKKNLFEFITIKCKLCDENTLRVMEITDMKNQVESIARERKAIMLMNATVSHEMRNPLNAINAANIKLEQLKNQIYQIIYDKKIQSIKDCKIRLYRVYYELFES